MEYLFAGLALGCLVFLFKIVSEYMSEMPAWKTKVEQAEAERYQHDSQVQALIEAKDNAAEKVKSIDKEIKTLEGMRDELKTEIDKTKKDLARQGKIIMKRQPDSS